VYYPLQYARESDQSKVLIAYLGKGYHGTKWTRDVRPRRQSEMEEHLHDV
jgi:hypothetical protein